MDYVHPKDAAEMNGLRLVLTKDVPAPYSMSARAIFDHHRVDYVAVAQNGGAANESLRAWTKHRNAPIALLDNEAPRTGWLDILNLAERLGSGPSLIPQSTVERMNMFAITNELIGENGWIWQLRIIMLGFGGPQRAAKEALRNPMYADYGYSEQARENATEKVHEILALLTKQLNTQYDQTEHAFVVGNSLSALDIYWVYFSQLLSTLPEEICPTPSYLRKSYDSASTYIGDYDGVLIDHRDRILHDHLAVPLTF